MLGTPGKSKAQLSKYKQHISDITHYLQVSHMDVTIVTLFAYSDN